MGSISYVHLLLLLLLCAVVCTVGVGGEDPPAARKMVAVEGVVYCKVCARDPNNSFHHVSTLSPLVGAVVKLQCNNTRKSWEDEMKTGEKGEFLFMPEKKVTTWGAHKCKLFLISSPRNDCIAPTAVGRPYFDDTPWKSGFALTKTNTSTSLNLQYYASVRPLLYFYYWPDCM